MAYRDPYVDQYNLGTQNNYHGSYAPRQTYDDMGPDYDPYSTAYDSESNQPYHDSNSGTQTYPPQRLPSTKIAQRQPSNGAYITDANRTNIPVLAVAPVRKEGGGFDKGEFTPTTPKSVRAIKNYRVDHQGNLWTKGGRGRCVGRVCCCTVMTAVFLIVSIVLSLALVGQVQPTVIPNFIFACSKWIRPPSVVIGNVQTSGVNVTGGSGLSINLGVNISVNNPNYFSVDFQKIEAEVFIRNVWKPYIFFLKAPQIYYPINNTLIGGGTSENIIFHSRSQTEFTFPFMLSYQTTLDPQGKILIDLANKCGVNGGTKSNISVNYKITLGIRIVLVTISPVVANTFTFLCPISAAELEDMLKGAGS
ncbi:uncharacterized protein LACBIDRAFT_306155 [Laccaria bicolor S238N-H82]|uniref:Predicted protein n=1 Tax=Laccaria bicolor (strain S238N-H82 / ATCC MYA-4686) TaxID=486041 RepID=B0CSV9_LACBS|nr:uncharacterized protein LACBIDRAFT_306155 [Laccaria bicolor S238N-H82]EDR14379.1 predicted protein [Laccaria bicolor S238N-H82]|eukprot:XP_001874938.1 predicted protein [Laccaria bicolor S238N-H82]